MRSGTRAARLCERNDVVWLRRKGWSQVMVSQIAYERRGGERGYTLGLKAGEEIAVCKVGAVHV
jgi:hypothetical protein